MSLRDWVDFREVREAVSMEAPAPLPSGTCADSGKDVVRFTGESARIPFGPVSGRMPFNASAAERVGFCGPPWRVRAVRCGRRMNVREKQKPGDAVGRPRGRSSLLSDPGAKFFWEKRGERQQARKTGGGAIVRGGGASRRCRLRGGAGEEPWPESNTQGAEEEEQQHVPKCDANSLPDRRGGGENLDFPDGPAVIPDDRELAIRCDARKAKMTWNGTMRSAEALTYYKQKMVLTLGSTST
jgi:hypothetical protein